MGHDSGKGGIDQAAAAGLVPAHFRSNRHRFQKNQFPGPGNNRDPSRHGIAGDRPGVRETAGPIFVIPDQREDVEDRQNLLRQAAEPSSSRSTTAMGRCG